VAGGKPARIMDVTREDNVPRAQLARNIGVKAAFGFPVVAGSEVVGVLEFFSPEAASPDEPLLEVMAHVGTQLGRVAERRRAELELAHERDLLHLLMDNVPLCIYFKDTASRFTRINKTGVENLGQDNAQEVIGTTDFDDFPPEQAREYFSDEQRLMQTDQPLLDKVEYQTGADGREHWFISTKVPIRGPDGQITGLVGVSRDFTERKRSEEALAYERYLLHTLLDNLPDNIYFKDTASRFIRINRALANYFGLANHEQAIDKTDFDFFTPDHAQPAYDEQEIVRTGQPLVGKEEKETWLEGRMTWVSTTKMPFRDKAGKIIGILGISRDVDERKRSEGNRATGEVLPGEQPG
jgi:PAS domain S-box-containing protein